LAFSRSLEIAWSIVARIDKMISDAKPWELAKDENQKQTLNAVLYRAAESLRWLCVMLYPIMPTASLEIWSQLGLSDSGSPAQSDPSKLKWGELSQGESIGEVKPLFPRIDKGKTMAEINGQEQEAGAVEKVQSPTSKVQSQQNTGTAGVPPAVSAQREQGSGQHATEADAVPSSPNAQASNPSPPMHHATEADAVPGAEGVTTFIDITDFTKVELRVGEVLTAARIPKADKLLLLSVDIGEEKPRQILAGIAQYYEPEQLVGRKIAVVANLKPRKMRGYESQGMLLAASVGDEGKPVIATFTEDVPNGARLK
jgi:methionyl-tRNA synthetase